MNILVFLKQVPDLVEELDIDASGVTLDRSWLRFMPSEYDEHALEQALLLKEKHGGTVHAAVLDAPDADEVLYTALAKGADSVSKICGDFDTGVSSSHIAEMLRATVCATPYDLIVTGVQAIDDFDGPVGALLAARLSLPYVGSVNGIDISKDESSATVKKEYPGGVFSEIHVHMPAVLGIQAAMQPPRYVPIARIRQARSTASIAAIPSPVSQQDSHRTRVLGMRKLESGSSARMLEGEMDVIAAQLIDILTQHGIVR